MHTRILYTHYTYIHNIAFYTAGVYVFQCTARLLFGPPPSDRFEPIKYLHMSVYSCTFHVHYIRDLLT